MRKRLFLWVSLALILGSLIPGAVWAEEPHYTISLLASTLDNPYWIAVVDGAKAAVEKLGANEFCRLRIGIGDNGTTDSAVYVLQKPRLEERPALDEAIERARQAVLCWIEHGIEKAMNEFNSEPPEEH